MNKYMDTLNIKDWADKKFAEDLRTIKEFITTGIKPKEAYHMVMDSSILGEGYKSQMRQEIGLTMFD